MKKSDYLLYGMQGSGSAAIEAALDVCGAKWNLVKAASWEPDQNFEALKALNPLGLVPTVVLPDGSVMTESAAILMHLDEAFPESGLLPHDASDCAQAQRGLVYIAAHCYAAIGILDYPERWCEACDEATAKRLRAGTRAKLHRNWEIFADTFANQRCFGGDRPGALDLLAAVVTRWSGTRAHVKQARPAFHQALQRIEQHAVVAPVFARHWP